MMKLNIHTHKDSLKALDTFGNVEDKYYHLVYPEYEDNKKSEIIWILLFIEVSRE